MVIHKDIVRLFCMSLFIFTLAAPCQSEEVNEQLENRQTLAWSQSDGLRFEIFSSSYKEKNWSTPVKITDNNANNLHPAIDIAANGTRWLFWSAVRPDGISIEYAVSQDDEWSEPTKMALEQNSAITPSVLIDKKNVVWLVWAGNDGGNDEIFYSRFVKQAWQDPKVVNTVNDLPDIKPVIGYNEQGILEVTWLGFRDGQYKKLFAIYGAKGWSTEQVVVKEEEIISEEE